VGQSGTSQARAVPLIGREAELERLVDASRAAGAGHGTIMLVSGEPGMGKTAMLAFVVQQAAAGGARVAAGVADELQQRVPFATVSDCLGLTTADRGAADRGAADPRAEEVAALLRGSYRPSGGTFTAADAEFLIADAILGLVDDWCAEGPAVLAVDDLEWADPASLLVLHRLSRVAGQLPLLIAATRRAGAGGPDVDRLVQSWEAGGAELLQLGPLDECSVADLAGQVAGTEPADGLLETITTAPGNPLYIMELARALADDGEPRAGPGERTTSGAGQDPTAGAGQDAAAGQDATANRDAAAEAGERTTPGAGQDAAAGQDATANRDAAAEAGERTTPGAGQGTAAGGAVPGSLITMVTGRLSGLSPRVRELLPVAAILGPAFTVAELAAVLGTPAPEFLGEIQEAVAAGVLVAEADRLVFAHQVTRQALCEALPPSARAAVHQQAGQALVATGAPMERAAQHLLAGTTFDARTLRWLAGSAERLSARAPGLAADLLRRALGAVNPLDGLAGPLRLALASALLRAGDYAAAEAVAGEMLAVRGDGVSAGRLNWILVQAQLGQGHAAAALAGAQRALDGRDLTGPERARLYGLAARCLHALPEAGPDPAMRAAEGARHEGVASGDPYAMAHGLQAVADASRWLGRFGQAAALAGQAAEALERAGPVIDGQLGPHLIRANCLVDTDRDAEAQRAYATGLRLAERGVGTYFLCLHHLSVARMHFLAGRWDDALSEISSAREVPDHLGMTGHLDGLAALIAVHREDHEALGRLRAGLDDPAAGTIWHTVDDRSWGRALAAQADGKQDTAFGVLSEAWRQCVAGHREYCGHHLLPDLAALAVDLGEEATAWQAVAELERYAADRGVRALHRSAAFATAILEGDASALHRVADAYAAVGRPLFEGLAREHAAVLLAEAGRAPVAGQQLDAALECYASLDATWDAARAGARLRAHGLSHAAHGPPQRPKSGWASLTETERKVAALVAQGMPNPDIASRMFTSRRTVQHHVSSVLAKLGLSSRIELATLLARRAD
jgi:DNA-binding CsgD family transcriptional regulator